MSKDYFREYLKIAPFALAIWRDQEAKSVFETYKAYQKKSKVNSKCIFKHPLLDIGCGFGEFAGVFFESQVEVGIDISIEDLIKAKKINKYKNLIPADARKLPFKEDTFSTVVSVSVLEHIRNPQLAIKEAYRVLRPGGLFIFTVITSELNNCLFYPVLFSNLGLHKISSLYLKYYHQAFKHVNVISPEEWLKMTENAGFKVLETKGTFSSRLTKIFDLALLAAFPSQISRWLFGVRFVWGLPLKRKILDPIYKYCLDDKTMTKSNIIVIAEK